jgi:hypothetical protein
VQPRLHRLLTDSKDRRGLLRARLLDVTHYKDSAECFRQIIDSSFQKSSKLVLSSCALGVLVWSDHRRPINLHSAMWRCIDDIKMDCAAPPPPPLQRLVECNAREPRRKARITAEIDKPGEGPNISLLHDVFRFVVVLQDTSRDAVQVSIVSSDQDAKRSWVSITGESEKFTIARLAHV